MFNLSSLFFIVVATSVGQAGTLVDLFQSQLRPTMRDIQNVTPPIISPTGMPMVAQHDLLVTRRAISDTSRHATVDQRVNIDLWLPKLLGNGPKLIAAFEKTYPGARWVFLGRDGLPWADLFEAFYLSIGQPDRVIRVGISKPSMVNVTDHTLLRLMAQEGIDLDRLPSQSPVVFVDSVSTGFGRQGRRLIATLYREWIRRGRDPLEIVNKVDMIGLIVSTFRGRENDFRLKPLHQFMQSLLLMNLEQQPNLNTDEIWPRLQVLTYPQEAQLANESGYTHFLGAWHDSFGEITEGPYGLSAKPGISSSLTVKKEIVWIQSQIWNFVNTGACLRQVQQESAALGVKFPMFARRPTEPNRFAIKEFRDFVSRPGDRMWEQWVQSVVPEMLPAILTKLRASIQDYGSLLVMLNSARYADLEMIDWDRPQNMQSIVGQVKLLQQALNTGCEQHLEARSE